MIRARSQLTFAVALAASFAANASEVDSARKDAESGTITLEQRPCPALGDRNYLRGLTNSQQLVTAAEKERVYEEGALRQLQQIMRDPQLAQRQRSDLRALASWSIVASMANWSMLQVAQQALADPLIAPGQPYPAALIEGARERLRQMAENSSLPAEAANVARRQAGAVERCAKSFNTAIFKLNEPQFEGAIESAKSIPDLDRVVRLYRAQDAANGGYGADSLDKLGARRAAITEAERAARENAAAVNAAEAAKRQAEAEKRQAELIAKLPVYLAVAKRFADAAQSGNERGALAELSPDVVMNTPQGNYRGINQVVAAVRQQSASGQSGSLGTPRIEGNRILANGNSGPYRIVTSFSFDDGNRISRIDVSL